MRQSVRWQPTGPSTQMQFAIYPNQTHLRCPAFLRHVGEKFKSLTAVTSPSRGTKGEHANLSRSAVRQPVCCASGTVAVSITLMAALLNDLSGRGHHASHRRVKSRQNSVTTRNPAGNNNNHGETSIEFAPSLSNAPQLLNGSCVPNPRKLRKDSKRIMLGTAAMRRPPPHRVHSAQCGE